VLGPVAERMQELTSRVRRAHSDAVTARLGVEAAPGLLGATAPRRYLLLLGNPAEARDLGGHLGNWAEVVATDGRLEVVRVGGPYDLFGPAGPDRPFLADRSSFPRSLLEMNPTRFPQNWGATPDLPTVARLAAELYPQSRGGAPLDGVIYADPTAFAAAIGITGPVPVPGTDITVDSDTAAQFLERGQYGLFSRESEGDEAVTELVRTALDRLLEGRLPAPDAVASAFGPSVDGGHLKFFSLHESDRELLERLHLDGAIAVTRGDDALAVITRNANPSKIDSYLKRSIDQRPAAVEAATASRSRSSPSTYSLTTSLRSSLSNGSASSRVTNRTVSRGSPRCSRSASVMRIGTNPEPASSERIRNSCRPSQVPRRHGRTGRGSNDLLRQK